MGSRAEPARAGDARRWQAAWLPWLNLAVVVAIVALDWITPAGVVVGILLGVPIILTSMHDSARLVWVTAAVALGGFLLAAGYGRAPIAPQEVWVPNRVFALLTLPASAYLALLLQRRRKLAEGARDLNRLLISLLAHDLRSPLVLATQGLDYVADTARAGDPLDDELIGELRARLQRSLRAVEVVLTVARENLGDGAAPGARVELSRVGPEIAAEVESFASEAAHRGKRLVTALADLRDADQGAGVDALVLRQALAILLDNAIRHAVPGEVQVEARQVGPALVVHVRDQGPGLRSGSSASEGAGVGLELARTLVRRGGGEIRVERDGPEGTEFALLLPLGASRVTRAV